MAELAILGHAKHGRDVIKTLEMLGGINEGEYAGDNVFVYYFINDNYIEWCHECIPESNFISFTLEEFFEKFPYKVGDKVKNARINDFIGRITNVRWDGNEKQIIYTVEWDDATKSTLTYFAKGLQPYKEETMEEIKIDIPKGYEFAGVDDDKQQVVFQKIQPQYPKTYEECCKVLGIDTQFGMKYLPHGTFSYKDKLIYNLQELLICRDAYWQIAGEQMGLGESWEPDWSSCEDKFCITIFKNKQIFDESQYISRILVFPTEEMRDAFYEYFKELIEKCKELL